MKRLLFFILAIFISFQGIAMPPNEGKEADFSLENFIKHWESQNSNFQKLNSKLKTDFSKYGKSQKFLKMLFYRSQKYLLGTYSQFSGIDDLMQEGRFDCVSGSLLLSVFLESYGFEFDVIETSYHVFVRVVLDGDYVILESTDNYEGFIYKPADVAAYLAEFEEVKPSRDTFYLEPTHQLVSEILNPVVFKVIEVRELKGLEYFNKAIFHNNKGEIDLAYNYINQAESYYGSKRIKTMKNLIQSQLVLAQAGQ
ncbi:hypothetical protein [Belliella aquatica]|nr:hypothetical protein [Belliella aquatica]MCH7404066.1 hypothetical protein [Belliella aquatica]